MKNTLATLIGLLIVAVPAIAGGPVTPPTPFASNSVAGKVIPDGVTCNVVDAVGTLTCNGVGSAVSVTAATPDVIINPTPGTATFTVGSTNAQNSPADGGGHSYTILSSDLAKQVVLASTFTAASVPQATGSFAAGSAFTLLNKGALTATPTTSTVNGAASIALAANETSYWTSDGTNWLVTVGAATGKIASTAVAQTFTASQTFGEAHGTTYAPALTSNNYNAATTDCGKTLLFPTGTTPTLTLPNLNAACTIVAVQNSAVQFTVVAASGGSVVSVNAYTKSKAQNAVLFLTIIAPSASAATWVVAGDGA